MIDTKKIIKEYLDGSDWRIKENSNMAYSLQGLNNHVVSHAISDYWLKEIYPERIGQAHIDGDMHIHDLSSLSSYCVGWDLKDLLIQGFTGVDEKVSSAPPKHLRSALGQLVNFLYTAQGESAGAQAVSSFDTYLAPFVRYDGLTQKDVKQAIQEFVFNMNVPTRVGFQSVFSNITLDISPGEDVGNEYAIIGGKMIDEQYKDFQKEMDMINIAFCDVMMEGDSSGRIFTFPIPTYNLTKDFDWDSEVSEKIFKMTGKYGIPYFSNFISSDMDPSQVRSMCPLAGDESILIESSRGYGVEKITISEAYRNLEKKNKDTYKVYTKGTFDECTVQRYEDQDMLDIELVNGHHIKMTETHTNLAANIKGDVYEISGADLDTNDYLPYKLSVDKGTTGGTFDVGYLIGCFAGDGSLDRNDGVIFSLSIGKKEKTAKNIIRIVEELFGARYSIKKDGRNLTLRINSKTVNGLCREFVSGKKREKHYNPNIFSKSEEFRRGIHQGHYETDGGNRHRIYTSSLKMVEDLNMLAATLGTTTNVSIDYRKESDGKYADADIYTVRFYKLNRNRHSNKWFKHNGFVWFKIKSIKRTHGNVGYCLVVPNDDELFTAANTGIVTHNCRLRIDNDVLRKRGGGLFGSAPLTGCYSSDTEVLTDSGWKRFTDLDESEKVLSLDKDTGIAEWNKPTEYFEYDFDGELVHFDDGKGMDVLVTPDHKMFIEKRNGERLLVPANEVKEGYNIPKKCKIKTNGISDNDIDFYNFAAAFSSDGSLRNRKNSTEVRLCAKKDRKIKLYKNLAEKLGKYNVVVDSNGIVIYSKELEERIQKECYVGDVYNSHNKKLPNIWEASESQMKLLFEILLQGDGHVRENGQMTFYTVSPTLAGDVQKMALYNNLSASISTREPRESITKDGKIIVGTVPELIVNINTSNNFRIRKDNIKMRRYKGTVHCLTVKNHIFYVRRNGRACWSGNSIGVVTLNLPRIGYEVDTMDDYLNKISELMDLAKESLEIKRKVIEEATLDGLYPYSRHYLKLVHERFGEYWKNHFSTIGLIGVNEASLNLIGKDLTTEEGHEFAKDTLGFMRNKLLKYQEETGDVWNLEATPAEGTTRRLAAIDKKKHPDIIVANQDYKEKGAAPYYTNSSQLPVGWTSDPFEALDHQNELQTMYTGGCVEAGNKVITTYGDIKIEDIVNNFDKYPGIKALSYNQKTGEGEWDTITDVHTIDVSKKNKIRVVGEKQLDIVTTDWHPFFIDSKGRVEECRADELVHGDVLIQNETNLLRDAESNLDKDMMYLIGNYIGNGTMSNYIDDRGGNELKKAKIRIESGSVEVVDKLVNIINNNFETSISSQKVKNSNSFLLSSASEEVVSFFNKYGFNPGPKAKTVTINESLFAEINKENFKGLISGLIDSDGHIAKDGIMEYSSISKNLIEKIVGLLSVAGISSSYTVKKSTRDNEQVLYRLYIQQSELYKIKDWGFIKNIDRINEGKRCRSGVFVKTANKESIDDTMFYDLTTEKNHNYLCGKNTFVFIHNTVHHLYLGQSISDYESVKVLVRRIAENYAIPYYTITPTFSVCPIHGYIQGEHHYCPKCDAELQSKMKKDDASKANQSESEV